LEATDRRVRLDGLILEDFRNIERASLEPHPRFNVVTGPNGMGKTNLLEAIYLIGALRSFRTATRRELIRHEAALSRVTGAFGDAAAGMRCEIALEPDARRVRVDGVPRRPGADHFRELPMVLFHPDHVELVRGGPEGRRRFLDRALYQADRRYPTVHRDYLRALASRNRLLRDDPPDGRSLALFEDQLAANAERLIAMRRELVLGLAPLFDEAAAHIGGGPGARVRYRPSREGERASLAAAWERSRGRDGRLGHTAEGPHADELLLELDGRPARRFASQGQQRTLALALKIAETRVLTAATERIPLVLLDDVSSELDRERNRRLFEFLTGTGGQVFITSTHPDHVLVGGDRRDWRVDRGEIRPA
jgi:DNA replication and repair protein RecF